MTDTRVYVLVGEPELRAWSGGQDVDLADRPAHAVTSRVRDAFPEDDEEELEYAALWSAAETGPGDGHGAGVTVVAALDLPSARATASGGEDPDRGFEVRITGPVTVSGLVALHVLAADAGPDDELSWYDAGELNQVRELLA